MVEITATECRGILRELKPNYMAGTKRAVAAQRPTEVYGVKCNQQGWTQNGSPTATSVMMPPVFASYAAAEEYISKLLLSAEDSYTGDDDYRDCDSDAIREIAMLKQNFTPILVGNQGKSYPLYEVVELPLRG